MIALKRSCGAHVAGCSGRRPLGWPGRWLGLARWHFAASPNTARPQPAQGEPYSRMRSEGFPFIVWGSGGWTRVRFVCCVPARSRRVASRSRRGASLIPCHADLRLGRVACVACVALCHGDCCRAGRVGGAVPWGSASRARRVGAAVPWRLLLVRVAWVPPCLGPGARTGGSRSAREGRAKQHRRSEREIQRDIPTRSSAWLVTPSAAFLRSRALFFRHTSTSCREPRGRHCMGLTPVLAALLLSIVLASSTFPPMTASWSTVLACKLCHFQLRFGALTLVLLLILLWTAFVGGTYGRKGSGRPAADWRIAQVTRRSCRSCLSVVWFICNIT